MRSCSTSDIFSFCVLSSALNLSISAEDKETEIASQLEAARQDLMQREDKNSQLLKQIKEL